MNTGHLVAWYGGTAAAFAFAWWLTRKQHHTASRALIRTGVLAVGLAAVPYGQDWLPAALYFTVGRDWMESLGISLVSISVVWGGLFAAYWLVLVYRDALFGGRGRKN